MNDKVQEAIDIFMSYLRSVGDLHHLNDEKRLYNIALEAVRAGVGVPRDEMKTALDNAVREQNLNPDWFEKFFKKYMEVLERAHYIIAHIHSASPINKSFRF